MPVAARKFVVDTPPQMARSWPRFLVAGVASVAFAAFAWRSCTSKPEAAKAPTVEPFDDSESPIPVTAADPVRGPRDAPVTIVMFASFQCPYAAKAQPMLVELEALYGKDKLRLVWKTLLSQTHDKARAAAIAGAAVHGLKGNLGFWKFHESAFRNQAYLGSEAHLSWGEQAGIEKVQLRAAIAEAKYENKVNEDDALARKLGAIRSPTYFVNGTFAEGQVSLERWKRLVDAALAKANEKRAAGVPPDRIYVETSRENAKGSAERR